MQTVSAPFSRFSAATIARLLVAVEVVVSISARTVSRWLKSDKLKPWRHRSWITPKDLTTFLPRACDVLDLYERVAKGLLQPGEVVLSADEKTSIQARQHATHTPPGAGEPAHVQHTYARRGAVNLIASLNVATGTVFGKIYAHKTFREFTDFLTDLLTDAVKQGNHTIHLLLDNGSTHRPKYLETWLNEAFPDVKVIVHWLPVRSSWLNQIEIFFGILQAHALTPNNFPSTQAVADRILRFIDFHNQHARAIAWTYTSSDLRRKYSDVKEPEPLPVTKNQAATRKRAA